MIIDALDLITTTTGSQRLGAFLAALTDIVDRPANDQSHMLTSARAALERLVGHDDWLDDEFARPHPDHGQQFLLYCDPRRRFSVVSVVWGPGHGTPIHDHTVWGLVGVLRGAEIEETFVLRDGMPQLCAEARLEPGEVVELSPSEGDIHRVSNAFVDRSSVSIHVYGADIGSTARHIYPPGGGLETFTTGYANSRLPSIWRSS